MQFLGDVIVYIVQILWTNFSRQEAFDVIDWTFAFINGHDLWETSHLGPKMRKLTMSGLPKCSIVSYQPHIDPMAFKITGIRVRLADWVRFHKWYDV